MGMKWMSGGNVTARCEKEGGSMVGNWTTIGNASSSSIGGLCVLELTWTNFGNVVGLVAAALLSFSTLLYVAVVDARKAKRGLLKNSAQSPDSAVLAYLLLVVATACY